MIEVEFSTAMFGGVGGISCACGRQVWFPQDCAVLRIYFQGRQVVSDALTKEVFHDCSRPREWVCPECLSVYEPKGQHRPVKVAVLGGIGAASSARPVMACRDCHCLLVNRPVAL